MSTAKNSLIALLALTTVGGAALGWYQYKELIDLRANALTASERADLQKKIWDLQKANRELTDQLAVARAGGGEGPDETVAAGENQRQDENASGPRNWRGRGQQFAAMRELMQKPEFQALRNSAERGMIDARYAALFHSLNLTPDQATKLTSLLAERQNALQDVYAAAREQGVNPRTDPAGFQKLLADAQNPINESIKSVIGDTGFSQLNDYEQTMPQRNLVNALQQRLTYSDSPLSPAQANQLVQILAANSPSKTDGGAGGNWGWGETDIGFRGGGFGMGPGGGGGAIGALTSAPITSQAVSQASTVLTSTQLTALQQLQVMQQNAQQMRQLWQQTAGQNGGNPPPAGGRRGGG